MSRKQINLAPKRGENLSLTDGRSPGWNISNSIGPSLRMQKYFLHTLNLIQFHFISFHLILIPLDLIQCNPIQCSTSQLGSMTINQNPTIRRPWEVPKWLGKGFPL